jgi:hypothetical protein
MAIKKLITKPEMYVVTSNPNTLAVVPGNIGDLAVDSSNKQLFFAFGLAGTQWGTCGTAGN